MPEGAKLFVLPGASLTIRPEDSLTNNGTIIVDGTLNAAGSYYGKSVYVSEQGTVTPDTVPQRTELIMEEPSLVGPDSLDTNAWGVYDAYTFAENDEQIPSSAEWSIVETNIADAEIDSKTGDLYAGTSAGEIVIRASTEYGSCDKTILVVQGEPLSEPVIHGENTPGLFIEGPDSLGVEGRPGYNVCAYNENGTQLYLDAEWSIVETDIADATVDAETGFLYTGSSPGKIVLRATTEYGTSEKTVTIEPYEELEIPVWVAVLVLVILLAAIVFIVVRVVIAIRRKKKRSS